MRRKNLSAFFKEKGFAILVGVCALAVIAMAGVFYLGKDKDQKPNNQYVDLNEPVQEEELADQGTEDDAVKTGTEDAKAENFGNTVPEIDPSLNNDMDADVDIVANLEEEPAEDETNSNETVKADSKAVESKVENVLEFSPDTMLEWPVEGNIILDYSMDNTIYFATLDQYKCNPAILIQAAVNTEVVSSARGEVTSIENSEETGTTVVVDLGSGYQLVYGQLKEVQVEVGDTVEAMDTIGYLNEPTKYYVLEGSNLYFQVLKDGAPVDPMSLLKE